MMEPLILVNFKNSLLVQPLFPEWSKGHCTTIRASWLSFHSCNYGCNDWYQSKLILLFLFSLLYELNVKVFLLVLSNRNHNEYLMPLSVFGLSRLSKSNKYYFIYGIIYLQYLSLHSLLKRTSMQHNDSSFSTALNIRKQSFAAVLKNGSWKLLWNLRNFSKELLRWLLLNICLSCFE